MGTVYVQEKAMCSHSEDYISSDDSFCWKIQVQQTQTSSKKIPTPTHLITNLAYRLKPHHSRNKYLRARLDTCTDVNIMPASVYFLLFKDPELKKLDPCNMKIEIYTKDAVKSVGSCKFYLVHLDTKQLQEVTFFVAKNDGSVLLSCTTTLVLGIIQPRTRLDYLPTKAGLIPSTVDHPQKTRCQVVVHSSTTDSAIHLQKKVILKQEVPKLITSKEQIFKYYPDVFEGIGKFPSPPYYIQLDPGVPSKQAPCNPFPVHLNEAFQEEVNKMLQAGVLKPVQEATLWINSFVLVEEKDMSGNLMLRICLDPTNLDKAIVREP